MLSMEPSIKRGLTFWDRALMPKDEFEERIHLVREVMRGRGLEGLVVTGHMYEDAALLWLTAGPVDGTLVLTLEGEPALFTNSGSREEFFLRELTFVNDLSYRGPLVGDAVRTALEARGVMAGRIGLAGLDALAARPYHDILQALSAFALEDVTADLAALRATLRPRERAAQRIALGMARQAATAASACFAGGGTNTDAVVEAERVARLSGAWDVRVLANLGACELRPFERLGDERRTPLLLWVAARFQGYWADQAAVSPKTESEADRAIAAMMAASCTGAPVGAVADAGLAVLSERGRQTALAYGLGSGIGIELRRAPVIAPSGTAVLTDRSVLSLRVFAGGDVPSLAAAVVEVKAQGAVPVEPLERVHR